MMRNFFFLFTLLICSLFISCAGDDAPGMASEANVGVPAISWSTQISSLGSIDVEWSNGDKLLITGDYTGNPGITGLQQVTQGIRNGFLLQMDQSGQIEATMDLGLQVFHDLNYLSFLPNGNPIVSGKAVGFQNVMYLELNPATNTQVANQEISGSGNDKPAGIAIDQEGNIILGGIFNGTVRLENGDTFLGNILGSAAIVKYNASGEVLWSLPSPPAPASSIRGLGVDNSGNIYCYECIADMISLKKISPAGALIYTNESLGSCGYGLEVVNDSEIYLNTVSDILRIDGEANIQWTVASTTQLQDIAVKNGRIVVAGNNFSGGQFGPIEALVRSNYFMASLTTDGRLEWLSTEIPATDVSLSADGTIAFANHATGMIGVLE
ncbi:MAG: hypothetical protein R8G66_21790 [Cytophagales bacterium]|nr:hypothetical protein [Cytophagales bacterium]